MGCARSNIYFRITTGTAHDSACTAQDSVRTAQYSVRTALLSYLE